MTFELYADEISNRVATLPGVRTPEAGAFDNFFSGAGRYAMQGLAKTGRAIDMLGAVAPIIEDKISGGTEAQDRYFKEHDEVFNRAVDYWTPKPGEVGVAGEVVGQLLGTLPQVIASPGLTIASTQLSTAEDLVRKGIDADKAQAAGAVQAAGLGLGIWVPILGKTLAQRMLLGGAGFNVAQGVATRGATAALLDGTAAEGDFKALDASGIALDALLGLAFGGLAHIRPEMRAEGEAWAKRLEDWSAKLKPTDVDALVAMRQAQHLSADSMPGRPVDIVDQDAHVQRIRQAIDDLAAGRPVDVEGMPAARFEPDPVRKAQDEQIAAAIRSEVQAIATAYDTVMASPLGAAGDPIVHIRPDDIEGVILARGGMKGLNDIEVKGSGYGLIKFIWRHGEASGKAKEHQITKADLMAFPMVIRDFEPTRPAAKDGSRGREWRVPLPDENGKVRTVVFADNLISGQSGRHLVTVHVQEPKKVGWDLPLSEKRKAADQAPGAEVGSLTPDTARAVSLPDTRGPEKPLDKSVAQSPLAAEAARFAAETPDLPIAIGKNADGSDIVTTPAKLLEDADNAMKRAQDDVKLLDVAAACLLGAS
jgi:hypothetical protein